MKLKKTLFTRELTIRPSEIFEIANRTLAFKGLLKYFKKYFNLDLFPLVKTSKKV